MGNELIQMNICKSFPGVRAVDNVSYGVGGRSYLVGETEQEVHSDEDSLRCLYEDSGSIILNNEE